jgi:hypothetical protein
MTDDAHLVFVVPYPTGWYRLQLHGNLLL